MAQKKTLSEQEMEMVGEVALLRAQGKSWKEASKKLGTGGERLRKLARKAGDAYWQLVERAQRRAALRAAGKARARLEALLDSENERVALRAAQALLADQRGRERTDVLAEKNAIVAGKYEKSRHRSRAFAEIDQAARTLAACRRAEGFGFDEEEIEPSPWQAAYDGQYGGKGDNGGDQAELIARAEAGLPDDEDEPRDEKNGSTAQTTERE